MGIGVVGVWNVDVRYLRGGGSSCYLICPMFLRVQDG